MIGSFTQGHLVPMMTPAAILRRIGRIDFDKRSASLFRFARQFVKKVRPCRVTHAFGKAVIMEHPIDTQVLNTDEPVGINERTAFLMREVIPTERYSLMDTRYGFAVLLPLRCSLCQFGVCALYFCQCLFFLAKELGIVDFRAIGTGRKRLESDINADTALIGGQAFRFTLNTQAHVPLASRRAMDSTGFDASLDRPVIDHFHASNLRQRDMLIMCDGKAALREGETIIASVAFETGVSWGLSRFEATKEGLHGQINPYCHILQDLRVNARQRGTFLLQYGIGSLLLIARQAFAGLFVGLFPLFKQVVIQPATFLKRRIEFRDLLFCRVDPILKHFVHVRSVAQLYRVVNGLLKPNLSRPTRNAPDIPLLESRRISGADR